MAEHLISLCSLIIEDLYGGLFAQIFGQLAQHGRMMSHQLAQRCHLPIRQIKAGLATLVQVRLVQHHTTHEGISTYHANVHHAYELLRIGKLVSLAHRHHGPQAAAIVEELALLGFATTTELEAALARRSTREGDLATGSDTPGHAATDDITESLRLLVKDSFIHKIRMARFQTSFDARQDAELHIRSLGILSSTKGKKAQTELGGRINLELEIRFDSYLSEDSMVPGHVVNRTSTNMELEAAAPSENAIHLYLNFSKAATYLRNAALSRKIRNVLGKALAKIAAAAIAQTELASETTLAQPDHQSMTQKLDITELRLALDGGRLSRATDDIPRTNGWHEDNVMTIEVQQTATRNHCSPDAELDKEDLHKNLAILAEGPFTFLHRQEATGEWMIDKEGLAKDLREDEAIGLIGERTVDTGLRLIRMLIDKGKLDEKSLQEFGLLGAKELRQTLAQLQMLGFLELQEVPREPQRQPNRTIFLWFYDAERVRKVLLGELYKTIARLYQRLRMERERHTSTLSKIERTDVQGSEEEILAAGELLILQQWRRKELWLMGEIDRLDESVAILRDL